MLLQGRIIRSQLAFYASCPTSHATPSRVVLLQTLAFYFPIVFCGYAMYKCTEPVISRYYPASRTASFSFLHVVVAADNTYRMGRC